MKQVVLESPVHFEESDAPFPAPVSGNALIQVKRVGECGSDFHAFEGRHPAFTHPRGLGHEQSGVFVGLSRDLVFIAGALFHQWELTILASRNSVGLFPRIINLIEQGKIDTGHWITNRLPLPQVASDSSSLTTSQSSVKAIVDFQEYPGTEKVGPTQ